MTPGQAGGAIRDARHGSATDVLKPGLVSIIIPNFNNAPYLADAIQSALGQTYRNFEVIVVDDGSTDNSREVVAGFGDQVHCIWQENKGLAGARNTGIRAASGEFIGLLDADDQWLSTYLDEILALAKQQPEAAVYYCQTCCMDEQGHDLPQILGGPVIASGAMYPTLLRANFLIPSTLLLRHSVVFQAGLFDASLRSCEDWDLWLRLLPEQRFVGTSSCLVRYRQHSLSLSKDLSGMQRAAQAVIEKNFGLDDGMPHRWDVEKRRAYGGLYRYFALTCVQRQGDWVTAATHLQRGLRVDPTLAEDLSLFYDLAMGTQPTGYRTTGYGLNLARNARQIEILLATVFDPADAFDLAPLQRLMHGTAQFAVGLLAYNTQQLGISRRALTQALWLRPELWRDARMGGNLLKSLAGSFVLESLRRIRRPAGRPSTVDERRTERLA